MWPFGRPNVGRLAARRDVPGLARALSHADPAIREAAAAALAGCEPAAAAAVLVPALTDPDEPVRRVAQAALIALDSPLVARLLAERLVAQPDAAPMLLATLWGLLAHEEARMAIEGALTAPLPTTRAAAARALGRRGDARAVAPLLRALDDAEPAVVEAAAQALVVVGAERTLTPLSDALTTGQPAVRAAVARVLGQQSDPRALLPLVGALADPDAAVRAAALEAIDQLPEPGRQVADVAGLGTSPVERERGAQQLRQIGTLAPLAATLRAVDYPGLRAAAARALARLGEPGTVAALAGALDDADSAVRQEAAWMLGVTGQAAALAPLVVALASAPDAELRATAARALGRLGHPGALEALTIATGDPVPAVAAAAERAVTTLRGASPERIGASAAILQVVVILQDAPPDERSAYAGALLDELPPATLPAGEAIQIVTLAPGRPLPSSEEALLLVRRRFQTAPPGYHWEVLPRTDPAGRAALLLRLAAGS